jgi:pilus assembly protein CpaE
VAVDSRLQFGDLSFFFNAQVRNSLADLGGGREIDEEVMEDVIIKHEKTGVSLLASPPRPEQAEAVTGADITNTLDYLRRRFEYVIVDTSSMLNEITLSAIDSSDLILLVTSQDIPSIKNIRLFMDIARALGIDEKRVFLVMNRFDKRRSITPERVAEITKLELLATIPLEERLVIPAMDRGEPFMIENSGHAVGKMISQLGDELKKRIEQMMEADAELG